MISLIISFHILRRVAAAPIYLTTLIKYTYLTENRQSLLGTFLYIAALHRYT